MRKILLLAILLTVFISCKKYDQPSKAEYSTNEKENNSGGSEASGHIKIAVISDIHYMHPSLLHDNAQNGEPFKNLASMHRPMVEYSVPIFDETLSQLLQEHPNIVLIPGNVALDGEKISHQAVADKLQQLLVAGIKVYVSPGRHDINNQKAAEYFFDHSASVSKVSAEEFKSIYKDFGYNNTSSVIAKDPGSLSYVAQPFPGLWILSIDAIKYPPYYTTYSMSGRIRPQTMQWIMGQLATAKEKDITVLGMMSHSLIEHLKDQNKFRPNTVVDNWQADADSLIKAGLKVVFTGTVHATDVTMRETQGETLYDVETGTLVGPPSPYRLAILKNKELDIDTKFITSIDATFPQNISFTDYSYNAFSIMLDRFFQPNPLGIPPRLSSTGIALARNGMMAHFKGDEKLSPLELNRINEFSAASPDSTKRAMEILINLWNDLNTKDNKWHIKLTEP